MILLDTHVVVHYLLGNARLGRRARSTVDRAQAKEEAFVSAMSYWEIAMLVAKRRLALDITTAALRDEALRRGIGEAQIDGRIGIAAAELPDTHGDPADRILVATAVVHGFTLLTSDDTLLGWKVRGFHARDASA